MTAPPCWLEIKNVHLSRTAGLAEFPDCVAARSTKHLRELAGRGRAGDRAVALFVIQRMDCDSFSACADLDPTFATALEAVLDEGVEALCYACDMTTAGVTIARRVPLVRAAVSPA